MKQYQYILEKRSKKNTCPNCRKTKFVRYIDTETDEYLPEQYGRCDREQSCGYFRDPYKDGYFKNNVDKNWKPPLPSPPKPTSLIPVEILKQSRIGYEHNNFVKWLETLFEPEIVEELIIRYHIGTSKKWRGSAVFWQIDINGNIRAGKIMQYNNTTGKRIKEPVNLISWVHSTIKLPDFNLKQCFFGEHLINGNNKPIAIVESEKTAIISSVYFPDFIWLATGGKYGCKWYDKETLKVLSGRNVYLFPDLMAYDDWSKKAKELQINIKVSDLLERHASDADKIEGRDLADYLIKFDYRKFTECMKIAEKNEAVENNEVMKRKSDGYRGGGIEKEGVTTLKRLNRKCTTSLESSNQKTTELFNTNRTYLGEEQKINNEKTKVAYVNDEGKLYIPTPMSTTYTTYPSVEHYNKRLCLPDIEKGDSVDVSLFQKIHIDLKTLTINPN
jgi:hypothetical protein